MGGFSGANDGSRQITPERISNFMASDNPLARMATTFLGGDFGSKLQGWLGQFNQQQQPGQQPAPMGAPQTGGAYPGFQMPSYTYHRSMPNFTNLNSGGTGMPAQSGSPYSFGGGGALNLPGWALQQGAQTGGTATGWKPTLSGQNQTGGGGGGNDWATILQQGYGYLPGTGFLSLTPQQLDAANGYVDAGKDPDKMQAAWFTHPQIVGTPPLFQFLGSSYLGGDQAQGVSGFGGNGPDGTDGGL